MPKFRKKPVVIEAVQFDGHNYDRIAAWMGDGYPNMHSPGGTLDLYIETLEGTMLVSPGDWVIKEPFPTDDRRFYPCKPDIFDATYEPVADRSEQ